MAKIICQFYGITLLVMLLPPGTGEKPREIVLVLTFHEEALFITHKKKSQRKRKKERNSPKQHNLNTQDQETSGQRARLSL